MPDDLKKAIIEAIAESGDENYKRLLMLLLRVEEMFIERVDYLAEQMTVPPQQHLEDHNWIHSARGTQGSLKAAAWRITVSVAEKVALVGAGAAVIRWLGN